MRLLISAIALAAIVGGCGGAPAPTTPTAAKTPAGNPPQTQAAACVSAPKWLIAKINENMTKKGVTLSAAYVGLATDISGAAGTFNEPGATAWWVGGKLKGVDELPAYWLVDSLDENKLSAIEGANSVAKKYNNWGVLGPDAVVVAAGSEAVTTCIK